MPVEVITAFFYEGEEPLRAIPTPPEAPLWPREVVTLGRWHALQGGGNRAFYRWLTRAYRAWFPQLPERTRLFRLCKTPQAWTPVFLAAPTVLGGIDTDGIALLPPRRAGRRPQPMGRPGLSHPRGMVGGHRCLLLKPGGWIVGGAWATATVAAHTWQGLLRQLDGRMSVLRATACHAAEGDPSPLNRCPRGAWEARRLVATGLSRRTLVCHFQPGMHRVWAACQARLACTRAAVHRLVQGQGLGPHASGVVPLSMADFSL